MELSKSEDLFSCILVKHQVQILWLLVSIDFHKTVNQTHFHQYSATDVFILLCGRIFWTELSWNFWAGHRSVAILSWHGKSKIISGDDFDAGKTQCMVSSWYSHCLLFIFQWWNQCNIKWTIIFVSGFFIIEDSIWVKTGTLKKKLLHS